MSIFSSCWDANISTAVLGHGFCGKPIASSPLQPLSLSSSTTKSFLRGKCSRTSVRDEVLCNVTKPNKVDPKVKINLKSA